MPCKTVKSETVKVETGSFTIQDDLDASTQCTVQVKVETRRYQSGDHYYYLSYGYTYAGQISLAKMLIPFTGDPDVLTKSEGDIVRVNPMTEQMVRYLLADDPTVAAISGQITPGDYRAKIMRSLSLFWD